MTSVKTNPPRGLFRGAVLLAAFAMVLGVAGIFYFQAQDRAALEGRPPDVAAVLIRGPGSLADIQVEARWRTPAGERLSESGRAGPEAGMWWFAEAPPGFPLTLVLSRTVDGGRRELSRQRAILTRGAIFEAYVPLQR